MTQWVISVFGLVFRWDQSWIWGPKFGLSPKFRLRISLNENSLTFHWSIAAIAMFVYFWMSEKVKRFARSETNLWRISLCHACKITDEFRLTLDSVIIQRSLSPNEKNVFTFWLTFGLSANTGLSKSLSERLIQNVKWPCDRPGFAKPVCNDSDNRRPARWLEHATQQLHTETKYTKKCNNN